MEMRRCCYKDVLPFLAMVSVESTNVGVKTLFKAATLQGMSYYVFILYAYSFSSLILLPLPLIFYRKKVLPPLSFSIICKLFLFGLLGLSAQMIGYKGLEYSSPTLSSAISNLTAPFTFILAVILRMEKLNPRSWRTRAKILGTIVSISGALIVVLYKGPTILSTTSPSSSTSFYQLLGLDQSQRDWVIGGLLFGTQYLLFSLWYIFQAHIMKIYPAELMVSFMYTFSVAIISAPICLISERNWSCYGLRSDIATVAIVYAGIFGPAFSTMVQSWGMRLKGPVYMANFKPLSIAIAAVLGILFLGDPLTIGSFVGAIIITVGFYAVLWGKAQEDVSDDEDGIRSSSSSCSKTPLLQSHKVEQV